MKPVGAPRAAADRGSTASLPQWTDRDSEAYLAPVGASCAAVAGQSANDLLRHLLGTVTPLLDREPP
jgi:hypothetical protein